MAYRDSEFGRLVRSDPSTATARICAVLLESDGSVAAAALVLEVPRRTLTAWIALLRAGGHLIGPVRPAGKHRRSRENTEVSRR